MLAGWLQQLPDSWAFNSCLRQMYALLQIQTARSRTKGYHQMAQGLGYVGDQRHRDSCNMSCPRVRGSPPPYQALYVRTSSEACRRLCCLGQPTRHCISPLTVAVASTLDFISTTSRQSAIGRAAPRVLGLVWQVGQGPQDSPLRSDGSESEHGARHGK